MIDFKKDLRDAIEKAGSSAKLSEESFLHYNKNYSVLKKSETLKNLIPGKVYTFYYDSMLKNENYYVNRRPVVFLESVEITPQKSIIKGFDLILLAPKSRSSFFTRLYTIFGKVMRQNSEKEISSQMPLRFDKEILETLMGGIKYNHSYKGYKIEKIKGLVEIPEEEWKYIIYLDTKSLEGAVLNDIYNKYS
jgi:hypothetical protein